MPKRIPTMSVVMYVEGKRKVLKAGMPYELTTAQIKEIEAVGGKDALRKPINEEANTVDVSQSTGGITNLDDTAANPDASVPAPQGAATSPTTGGKNPKPVSPGKGGKGAQDDEL